MKSQLSEIAGRLMRCPAAPYHESLVAREVLSICREHELAVESDPFGNLLVSANRKTRGRPYVLAAHLDHPGFRICQGLSARSWRAEFLGGVGDSYFQRGVPLRLHPGNAKAVLGRRLEKATRVFSIEAEEQPEIAPEFAVWDLPAFSVRAGRITGRACDDLIGAATILDVIISLRGARLSSPVIGVLSRAEEVGFHGALALAASRRLPLDSLVISLETSREMPPVKMGAGVIVRVGDRASTFDSGGTRFLAEVAGELAQKKKGFLFQRALMSGGTCEATAYQEHGYRCAAVCVALGNYHNCGANHRIRAEFVSLADAESMSRVLQEGARVFTRFEQFVARLPKRLASYTREARRELKRKPLLF